MKIRDAVSLVFVCSGNVFTIKRQNYLRSFPGYTAFPGGKIDECDQSSNYPQRFTAIDPVHWCAMVREAQEELSIDLSVDERILKITYLAEATSPAFNPYRFKTHFYRIEVKELVSFEIDHGEFAEGLWLSPQQVLDEWFDGKRLCVPPVRQVFETLASTTEITPITFAPRYNDEREVPHVETIHGLWQVMPLSDTVPPADRTNCFIFGEGPKIMVDPAPKDDNELKKFLNTCRQENIGLIFLTHHHSDHHRNLSTLLEKLKLPVALSQDSHTRILKAKGEDYFRGAEIRFISHGEAITKWLGRQVLCHHIPGHDEGHFGLAPESLEWFIVGDLFQGVGTVVIGGAEGNMGKYFKTLEYVINLSPGCVIPSHGIALGGTHILEKTLEHRRLREKQIFEMVQEGLTLEDMLKRIYFNIPEVLFKYARANIQSHLDKLHQDGMIQEKI